MKIIYFGSDVFLDVFDYFLKNHEILALYTYHNDEDYFNEINIVRTAQSYGIPVHYEPINQTEILQYIEQDGCEMFFVAEYSHKLPVMNNSTFKGINLHSSVLPEGRSYYPIECAMERELSYGGVTAHKLISKLDRGDIIANRSFPITKLDDSVDAYLYSGRLASEMVEEIFSDLENKWNAAIHQDKVMEYWNRPDPMLLMLNHDMTIAQAKEIYRRFNKMTMVEIEQQLFYVDGFSTGNAPIGTWDKKIVFVSDNRVLYSVIDGHLRLDIKTVSSR